MATVTRESVGLLTDKLTVHLSKEDYYPAFEKALKNYSKQAQVPGFRRGMAPPGYIKKLMGASVYTDEVLRTVEREINAWLEKERPDIFAQPLPTEDNAEAIRQLDMNLPGDYQFSFEIGLKPTFEVADLTKATIKRPVVKVTEDMVNEEIRRLQRRYGKMTEPEAVSSDEAVLNVIITEVDAEGNEVANGISKTNSLLVSYFAEAFRPQLYGLKQGDSLILTLDEGFEAKEKEWLTEDLGLTDVADADSKWFKLTITRIGLVEKRELNEEFFNQLFPGRAIATEAEFRAAVKEDLEDYWDSQARDQVHDEIYQYLMDNTAMELPQDFLKRWLHSRGEKPKTAEEVEEDFPAFLTSLKWNLISNKLMAENKLNVETAELREFVKRQMMDYLDNVRALDENTSWLEGYADRMMQNREYVDRTYNKLMTKKLFEWAENQVTNFNKVEMTVEEFIDQQQ
jgi:trigger factor